MKTKKWLRFMAVGAVAAALALAGCAANDGSDGADGAQGIQGPQGDTGPTGPAGPAGQDGLDGQDGQDATASFDVESCGVCHNDIAATHMGDLTAGDIEVSDVAATANGADLDIAFSLSADGMGLDGYTVRRGYAYYDYPTNPALTGDERSTFYRASIDSGDLTLVAGGGGDYTVTVAAASVVADAVYLLQLEGADGTRPVVVAQNGAPAIRDLVSNDGCAECHGNYVFNDSHYTVAAEYCQVCHVRAGRSFYIADQLEDETWDITTNAGDGNNLTIYAHGVHNSHSMPAGIAYFHGEEWSVGYPSAMRNCVSCHMTDDQLASAVEAPVSYYLCMSCHQSWDGFVHGHDAEDESYSAGDPIITGVLDFHRDYTLADSCTMSGCHGGASAVSRDEAGDFHNDFQSHDRHYDSFYRGVDISFANPNEVSFSIDSVTVDGTDVTFTWSASNSDGAVDPCNDTLAAGSPVFTDLGAYIAYAKGDDWVNEGVGSSPGQPASAKNLFTSLATTCAGNVATTTGLVLDEDALAYAEKALLAIGGKPVDQYDTGDGYYVRVPSPSYAFDVTDGASVAARRDAIATDKCLGCHQGTLYQHGGDRVDDEQLCVICHDPASSDKNNRLDRYQIVNEDGTVNTDATYDGKTSETYDLRVMIHAIHGIDQREETGGKPWTIYRSRGIYAFATPETEMPEGWPEDGQTIYGSTNDSTIAHNWTIVHYPKPANDCEGCHNPGTYEAPDQTKAVAVTVDAGTDWADQSDDTVIGPTAAACLACHAGAPVRAHANSFGYRGVVTREEMLQKAE